MQFFAGGQVWKGMGTFQQLKHLIWYLHFTVCSSYSWGGATWKMITKKTPKKSVWPKLGVPFWSHFIQKTMPKMEQQKGCVQKCVLGDFSLILGTLFDSFWWLLGPRRPKKGERVKMWKWAPRLSEKLTFEDPWGSKIDQTRPETDNWTQNFRGTIWDHSLGPF